MAVRTTRRARVLLEPGGTVLATARVADTHVSRLVGLLGETSLGAGDGLVLRPCRTVHTWFMQFPIDVLFVDDDGIIVRAVEALDPFRYASGGRRATTTIELAAGTLRHAGVAPGARIRLEPL